MTQIDLYELVMALSSVIDLINPLVSNHHKRVAFISYSIAKEYGLNKDQLSDIITSSALHDIGALSLTERMNTLKFEMDQPFQHAEISYQLLKQFEPFQSPAIMARYHHHLWDNGNGQSSNGEAIPIESHIIHLADRIEILINKNENILNQIPRIVSKVESQRGKFFSPELIDCFLELSNKECFWLDCESPEHMNYLFKDELTELKLDIDSLLSLSKLFAQIVDFRCSFTASHSCGVASSSEALALSLGYTKTDAMKIKIAGYLHDLGKLAVPSEVIEKRGELNESEFNIIKTHTYYTYRILQRVKGLKDISQWGAFHHERLDGEGYPFKLKAEEIPQESRIIAVADIFTALSEDRPYREGLDKETVTKILKSMVAENKIDSDIVDCLIENFAEINEVRIISQKDALKNYLFSTQL